MLSFEQEGATLGPGIGGVALGAFEVYRADLLEMPSKRRSPVLVVPVRGHAAGPEKLWVVWAADEGRDIRAAVSRAQAAVLAYAAGQPARITVRPAPLQPALEEARAFGFAFSNAKMIGGFAVAAPPEARPEESPRPGPLDWLTDAISKLFARS